MTPLVVDTNVAIVANGRDTHADPLCRLTCVERLESIVENKVVAVDDRNDILAEYADHLNHSGAPGVGDMFFRHVHNNQYASDRVLKVAVTPSEDDRRGFEELPGNTLDRSDRKFLAVAVVANATILNAVDSDWTEQAALTDGLGVRVTQLCPQHASKRA